MGDDYLKPSHDQGYHKGPDPDPNSPGQVVNPVRLGEGEERLKVK